MSQHRTPSRRGSGSRSLPSTVSSQLPRLLASSPSKTKPAKTVVSTDTFAQEIRSDLPKLFEEHPNGIFLADLHAYYGDSIPRIKVACRKLEDQGVIALKQSHTRAFYILPATATTTPAPLRDLTALQRGVVTYLHEVAGKVRATRVRTSYSHLSRKLGASYGGIHECVERLTKLGYLEILQHSQRGKENSLVILLKTEIRPVDGQEETL